MTTWDARIPAVMQVPPPPYSTLTFSSLLPTCQGRRIPPGGMRHIGRAEKCEILVDALSQKVVRLEAVVEQLVKEMVQLRLTAPLNFTSIVAETMQSSPPLPPQTSDWDLTADHVVGKDYVAIPVAESDDDQQDDTTAVRGPAGEICWSKVWSRG